MIMSKVTEKMIRHETLDICPLQSKGYGTEKKEYLTNCVKGYSSYDDCCSGNIS